MDGQPFATHILSANRTTSRLIPKAQNLASTQGLRYEANVNKALKASCETYNVSLELQPWFAYETPRILSHVVPDALIHMGDLTLVIEIKLTYIPEAHTKLQLLYLPVISKALNDSRARHYAGLVICKNLIPSATNIIDSLRDALVKGTGQIPTLQFLGGKFPW